MAPRGWSDHSCVFSGQISSRSNSEHRSLSSCSTPSRGTPSRGKHHVTRSTPSRSNHRSRKRGAKIYSKESASGKLPILTGVSASAAQLASSSASVAIPLAAVDEMRLFASASAPACKRVTPRGCGDAPGAEVVRPPPLCRTSSFSSLAPGLSPVLSIASKSRISWFQAAGVYATTSVERFSGRQAMSRDSVVRRPSECACESTVHGARMSRGNSFTSQSVACLPHSSSSATPL